MSAVWYIKILAKFDADVRQKPTQHRKAVILQLEINFKKRKKKLLASSAYNLDVHLLDFFPTNIESELHCGLLEDLMSSPYNQYR